MRDTTWLTTFRDFMAPGARMRGLDLEVDLETENVIFTKSGKFVGLAATLREIENNEYKFLWRDRLLKAEAA